jgi:hypothetical protein
MNKTCFTVTFLLFLSLGALGSKSVAAGQDSNSNSSPSGSTSCAIAAAPPERQGTIMIVGSANLGCGGHSNAEIDSVLLANCTRCSVVEHFTHACAAFSATANNNKSNTATGFAVVRFAQGEDSFPALKQAKQEANDRCSNSGGVQCYVRLSACDSGTYVKTLRSSDRATR